jgi:hypothetical protein
MGCFASKPSVPLSSPTSTAPAPRSEGPSHEADRAASQAASSSMPNAATQAPFLPSENAPNRAVHDPGLAAQLPSQAPPPFAASVPPPPHKPPQRGGLAPSSIHREETLVSPSSPGAAGTTTSHLVQPDIELNNLRPYEHNRIRPSPSPYHSVPIDRSKSAQPLSQSGLPPQAVLASSPPYNDGMPKPRPHEYDRKTQPSSYRSTPSVHRSMSAQLLSQSGLGASSSHAMARTMSASEFSSDTKSKDIPRKHPRSTPGTNNVHGAEDNGHRRFSSTVRTVLPDNLRYVSRRCLVPIIAKNVCRFRMLVVGRVRADCCVVSYGSS